MNTSKNSNTLRSSHLHQCCTNRFETLQPHQSASGVASTIWTDQLPSRFFCLCSLKMSFSRVHPKHFARWASWIEILSSLQVSFRHSSRLLQGPGTNRTQHHQCHFWDSLVQHQNLHCFHTQQDKCPGGREWSSQHWLSRTLWSHHMTNSSGNCIHTMNSSGNCRKMLRHWLFRSMSVLTSIRAFKREKLEISNFFSQNPTWRIFRPRNIRELALMITTPTPKSRLKFVRTRPSTVSGRVSSISKN